MSTDPARDEGTTTPAGEPAGVVAGPRRRLLVQVGAGVLLVMLLRAFVVQSFYVPSPSMEPTVEVGDRIVVSKVGASEVERGDVIVFDGTETFAAADRGRQVSDGFIGQTLSAAASTFSIDLGEEDYLKRVAGVGGDTVACTPEGGLVVDGDRVDEPWLPAGEAACSFPFEVKVPREHLFVLGDNRSESADSRAHLGDPGGGMVPVEDVIGHVVWRYWPPERMGGLEH